MSPDPLRGFRVGLLACLLPLVWLRAAVPVLDQVFPAAVQVGSTQSVTLVGKFDPWPVKVDLDIPATAIHGVAA